MQNNNSIEQDIKENTSFQNETTIPKTKIESKEAIKDNIVKDKLEKIKEAAHSNKIDRENIISSRQEEEFRNKKYLQKETKAQDNNKKSIQNNKFNASKVERPTSNSSQSDSREDLTKESTSKKNRADLKKQLSLGKLTPEDKLVK